MIVILAWRNLWRNSKRTLITTASITFAVLLAITMQSLQKGVFDNLIKEVVGFYYGYIQIHGAGYWDEPLLDNSIRMDTAVINKVERTSGVTAVAPRLESFTLCAAGELSKGCMVIGTDPLQENAMTRLEAKVIAGTYFQQHDEAVLLGDGLAARLRIGVGDTIVLLGQGYHGVIAAGKYPVMGLIHFGAPDLNKSLVYMPLLAAQQLFSTGERITSMAIGVGDPQQVPVIQGQIMNITGPEYEVMNWEQLMPDVSAHIKAENLDTYIYTGILYIIIAFGIFGTILMMTAERRFEFGILLAIGMQKKRMAWMLILETIWISMLGVITGIMISLPLVLYLQWKPIRFSGEFAKAYEEFGFEPIFPAILDMQIFVSQSMVVLVIALIVSLYPLFYVRNLESAKAMKR